MLLSRIGLVSCFAFGFACGETPPANEGPAPSTGQEQAEEEPIPEHLQHWPGLTVRDGDALVDAPEADAALARSYATQPIRGPLQEGLRLTLLTHRQRYRVGEEVRVIHVVEAPATGQSIYVMGPKVPHGEYVDGERVTSEPPTADYPFVAIYDGAVLESPAVDYNYDITSYRFSTPGTHRIEWRPGALRSNILEIEVIE